MVLGVNILLLCLSCVGSYLCACFGSVVVLGILDAKWMKEWFISLAGVEKMVGREACFK